jgi:hypothetical protein
MGKKNDRGKKKKKGGLESDQVEHLWGYTINLIETN